MLFAVGQWVRDDDDFVKMMMKRCQLPSTVEEGQNNEYTLKHNLIVSPHF